MDKTAILFVSTVGGLTKDKLARVDLFYAKKGTKTALGSSWTHYIQMSRENLTFGQMVEDTGSYMATATDTAGHTYRSNIVGVSIALPPMPESADKRFF